MRRFELVEGSSSKFWEIAQEGSTYTVCFGRIGTNGQTQTKDLGSAAAAAAAVAKLIAEKTKKGYSEVGGDGAPSAPSADDGAKPAKAKATKAKPNGGAAASSSATSSSATSSTATSSTATSSAAKVTNVATASAAKSTSAPEEEARGAGEPSAALLALSMPTRRFPHEDPTLPPNDFYDAMLAEKGLVGVIDELMLRGVGRPFARAFAKASQADFEAARAHGIERIAQLCAAPGHQTYVSVPAIALLIHQDDPEALTEVIDFVDAQSSHWVVFHALPLLSFLPDRTRWAKLIRRAFLAGHDAFDPATALVHLGPWVMPELVKLMARGDTRLREKVMAAVAASGTSEAASFILDHGDDRLASGPLDELMKDPPRAFRPALVACARSTKHSVARDVLARLLRRDPSLASLATTDPQRAVVASVLAEKEGPAASAIPDVLAKAPWEGRKLGKPMVVAGLVAKETPTEEVWPAGLREKWSALPWSGWASYDAAWRSANVVRNFTGADPSAALTPAQAVEAMRTRGNGNQSRWVLEYGGESFVMLQAAYAKAFWDAVHPTAWALNERATRSVVAVLGADALDGMLIRAGIIEAPKRDWIGEPRRASALPAVLDALLPIRSSRVVPAVAAGMVHRRARKAAIAWVLAHPETAALGLVPIAVSKPSKERTGSEQALRLLASQGHEDVVLRAAKSYGAEAEAAVRAVLATDPLALAKAPKLPAWLDLATLPPLRLSDGSILPDASRAHVVGMLAASAPDEAYAGLELAKEHLDPESLDELAWALFREWSFAGAPSKESWPFTSLAHAGGDRCVARLAPMVAVWPNDGLAARAQAGVEILGTIGTDAALVALHRFSQKAKTKGLKTAALEKMEEIAQSRGLTADELADRLVPDVGLDDAGTLELDLGDRVLTVGFDEHLAPFLREPDGARLTAFPKASKQGEPAKHKEAKARFAQLQKDVKEVAKHVLSRMENAMASGRGWPADVAESCFFTHPLMRHLAGRVAWTAWVDGAAVGSFRIAEDGSPSTPSDDAFVVPPKAKVTLLHPVRASKEEVAELGDRFADYELVQPFEQLTRPVFALAKGEGGAKLVRFVGKKVPSKRIFSLEAHGWTRTVIGRSSKAIGDVTATLQYSPGIDGSPDAWQSDEQTIGELTLEGGTLESLDALALSELLYDVERMFASE